ncbi:MAG TPA: penicillin-binding protein 2 [Steroidobacteraceae bacterium]|nr:penicillin-binding protein 2 [Steroidobacteraceae bacterium]
MPGQLRIKDHQKEQRFFLQRSAIAAATIGVLALVLIGRLVLLQIIRYDYYLDLAQGNRTRIEPVPANRGLIFDRNGKVLAENQPSYQLELIREQLPEGNVDSAHAARAVDATLSGLQQLGIIPAEEVADVRRVIFAHRGFEAVPIRLRLTEEEISRFAVHRHEFPGVDLRARSTRFYPYGSLGVHALGYVGAISEQDLARIDRATYAGTSLIGKRGVEAAHEADLHGVNGYNEIMVNAQGRSVERKGAELKKQPPRAGSDLVLSIDLPSQQAAEEAFAGRRGAAIAIDPHTGDVLVMASMPGFDASVFGRGITRTEYRALESNIDKPLFNRAISGTYPAGSTVKPVLGMAGLAYGLIKPDEIHNCSGVYIVPGSSRRAREGKGGVHGAVDLRRAIAKSCDVYFYALAYELGVDRIHEFLSPFGYGKVTGIDIAGEAQGLLPSREWKLKRFRDPSEGAWYPGDSVNFGIGQGFMTVTPVQLAQVTAVLAAKGAVFKPRLVTGVRDPVTGATKKLDPLPLPHVKGGTPEQWDVIMEGMRQTMINGTAAAISTSAEYHMAGKTGTAQVYSVGQNERLDRKVDERLRDHSWFIAFAPAEDPQIAVAVLVENGGFGAAASAPIARKIMDAYLLPRLKKPDAAAAPVEPAAAPAARQARDEKPAAAEKKAPAAAVPPA